MTTRPRCGREQRPARDSRCYRAQQFQPLSRQLRGKLVHASYIAAGMFKALRETIADHARARPDHHRHCGNDGPHRQRRRQRSRDDQIEIHRRKFSCLHGQVRRIGPRQTRLESIFSPYT